MKTQHLALLGGTPVTFSLPLPPWPPVNDHTAERLATVYRHRKWSFNGPAEQAFTQDFATAHDAAHGIFMQNGTVTLQCALAAYDIGPGDEIIVPALTWLATAMAAVYCGATPIFVDIEPTTLCLDPAKVAAAITPRTRAIIPVHLYGSMAELNAILAIAQRHNLVVIEDCAHAHGGKWSGRGVGSWGHVGSFSFQQSKTMTCGEGGICLTNDNWIAKRIHQFKHIGYTATNIEGRPTAPPPEGFVCHNFRATEFQAVILQEQLPELADRIMRYNANVMQLTSGLADVPGIRVQSPGRLANPQSYYALAFIFDSEPLEHIPIEILSEAIAAEGLRLTPTYGPVYCHTLFNLPPHMYRIAEEGCPVAEDLATKHTLTLPHQWLDTDTQTIDVIVNILTKVATNADGLSAFSRKSLTHQAV
jgi:dTDP-4-amino-4,6-dideoxygalactose transaminase